MKLKLTHQTHQLQTELSVLLPRELELTKINQIKKYKQMSVKRSLSVIFEFL